VNLSALGILALLLLFLLSWAFGRKLGKLRRELEESEARLGRRLFRVQGRLAEIEATLGELDFDRRRGRGEIHFDPGMKIEDAMAVHPRIREILGSFGISGSGCAGGALDETQSIREACRSASVDPSAVLEALRRFIAEPEKKVPSETVQAKLYQIGKIPGSGL
jgi:hypothetical protein